MKADCRHLTRAHTHSECHSRLSLEKPPGPRQHGAGGPDHCLCLGLAAQQVGALSLKTATPLRPLLLETTPRRWRARTPQLPSRGDADSGIRCHPWGFCSRVSESTELSNADGGT